MANADRPKSGALDAARMQNRRTIPTDPGGPHYADDLERYLDQLLDEALDERFFASDAPAVPARPDTDKT
jgi:hypothetical protein